MYCEIILVGNLGNDPEMRYTPEGRAVCNFSLAVNRERKNPETNEKIKTTTWFRVAVWGSSAEACKEYLTKGKQVLVVSEQSKANHYTTREGEQRASLEITARTVRFRSRSEGSGFRGPEDIWDDDLPRDVDEIPF